MVLILGQCSHTGLYLNVPRSSPQDGVAIIDNTLPTTTNIQWFPVCHGRSKGLSIILLSSMWSHPLNNHTSHEYLIGNSTCLVHVQAQFQVCISLGVSPGISMNCGEVGMSVIISLPTPGLTVMSPRQRGIWQCYNLKT